MELQQLIEELSRCSDNILLHLRRRLYKPSGGDGCHILIESNIEQDLVGRDDIVARLFDLDLFGWQIQSFDRLCLANSPFTVEYDVLLFKVEG